MRTTLKTTNRAMDLFSIKPYTLLLGKTGGFPLDGWQLKRKFRSRLVLVLGHTKCGAVYGATKASRGFWEPGGDFVFFNHF